MNVAIDRVTKIEIETKTVRQLGMSYSVTIITTDDDVITIFGSNNETEIITNDWRDTDATESK